MLREPTIEKLKAMKLDAMATAWAEQAARPDTAQLSFDERFGLLVDAEWMHRDNKRLGRVLREAKLRIGGACIEDIDHDPKREFDRAVVRQLASCRWVVEHQNVLITGMTGTGKTYVACALAQQACRKGYRAMYRRASRLFAELALARADGTYARVLARLAKVDVLVLDDWAMAPITDAERRDLLEVLEDRYGTRSTIVTSQVPHKRWHEHIGDPTTALPRIVTSACRHPRTRRSSAPHRRRTLPPVRAEQPRRRAICSVPSRRWAASRICARWTTTCGARCRRTRSFSSRRTCRGILRGWASGPKATRAQPTAGAKYVRNADRTSGSRY